MSEFKEKALQLSPEVYRQFKSSLETGKWPDGNKLTDEQRKIVMETIIFYEHAHLPASEHTGHIADSCKSKSGQASKSGDDIQGITIKH